MRNGEKEKEKKRRKWMKGVIETWDVRNDSGITMRTIKREIKWKKWEMKGKTSPKGEDERFCLLENKQNCPLTEIKENKKQYDGGRNL